MYEGYFGHADLETQKPIAPDTIYRIYSMTKVITCTAALMLYERGLYLLNDPLGEYLPEFKDLQVHHQTPNGNLYTAPAKRPILVKDLFTMSSGLTYGGDQNETERLTSKVMEELKQKEKAGKNMMSKSIQGFSWHTFGF